MALVKPIKLTGQVTVPSSGYYDDDIIDVINQLAEKAAKTAANAKNAKVDTVSTTVLFKAGEGVVATWVATLVIPNAR